jgi:hypothetical protein
LPEIELLSINKIELENIHIKVYKKMAFIYAIHDPFYPGCNDGDMDDRLAIKLYDEYLLRHPETSYIVVYIVGEGRYEKAVPYMNQHKRIIYESVFNIDEAKSAEKIIICAPVQDPEVRSVLANIIYEKKNGYCQGNKIGVTNFPNSDFKELLDSIPENHRYSTETTSISFPHELIDNLDPENKDEYMSYGMLKLIAIGGIIHLPSLIYRLYCPGIGGGPGTNMLKIQELIQEHLIPKMEKDPYPHYYLGYNPNKINDLKKMTIIPSNFELFNSILIDIIKEWPIYLQSSNKLIDDFMVGFKEKMPTANHQAMENSLKVMIYFARMCYATEEDGAPLFTQHVNKFYSLSEIPKGYCMINLEETSPMYDFVVAWSILNEDENEPTREKIMKAF